MWYNETGEFFLFQNSFIMLHTNLNKEFLVEHVSLYNLQANSVSLGPKAYSLAAMVLLHRTDHNQIAKTAVWC